MVPEGHRDSVKNFFQKMLILVCEVIVQAHKYTYLKLEFFRVLTHWVGMDIFGKQAELCF